MVLTDPADRPGPAGSAEPVIVVEVGSTYTKLVAFTEHDGVLRYLDRVATRTTVDRGDVRYGVDELLGRADEVGFAGWRRAYLTSSAAGGLRIAVSGLTPTLSTKVGTEIALGAGGVVAVSVAGRVRPADLARLAEARPGLVLLCGGTDHGEGEAVLANVAAVAGTGLDAVFLYAGNARVADEARELLTAAGRHCVVAPNVYPESDHFRFDEVRDLIRLIFERDVVKAPGVDALAESFGTGCVPTPLAVSRAVRVLGELLGDGLVAVDVGGATTDVHSVVTADPAGEVLQATFEPRLKRTVEGDLGVFHNLGNLLAPDETPTGPAADAEPILRADRLRPYAFRAAGRALARHAGRAVRVHGSGRHREIVYGADLRRVGAVLATGGALRGAVTDAAELAALLSPTDRRRLLPETVHRWLLDRHYLMSSLGALCPSGETSVRRFMDEGLKKGFWS